MTTPELQGYSPDQGRYAHVCGMCRGRGLIKVVAINGFDFPSGGHRPLGTKPAAGPGIDSVRIQSASVACRCPSGNQFRERFWTFDSDRMQTKPVPSREHCREIIAKVRDAGHGDQADAMQLFLVGKVGFRDFLKAVVTEPPFVYEPEPETCDPGGYEPDEIPF